MFRTTLLTLFLTAALCSLAAAAGRPAGHLSDLPASAQFRVLEALDRDSRWGQLAELTASNGTNTDYFGLAVAIDGNTVVVGATGAQVGSNANQGAAYVFVKSQSGWENMTQVAILTASDGKAQDRLGFSVAIGGDFIVVGGSEGGYLYEKPKAGWKNRNETVKLSCGPLVAISGDTVACGNAVYVKPETGWKSIKTYNALLEATDPGTLFFSLAIHGDVVVAGNWEYSNEQGAAYVFVRPKAGWGATNVGRIQTQTARLTASDGAADDGLGWSVAIHGDAVAVGAPGHSANDCTHCGAAYVFVKPADGWNDMTQTAELTDGVLQGESNLGSAVAIQCRTLLAGNPNGDNGNNHLGSAYLFIEPSAGWTNSDEPNATFTASDGQRFDNFGISAAISGNTVVIGSNRSNIGLTGAAYVFGH